MSPKVQVAALTDIGCRRKNNEDSFGYDEKARVYVVSDGMGGTAAGEVASQMAVIATVSSYGRMRLAPDSAILPAQDLLYHAVQKANAAVYARAQQDAELAGMGATLVALCLHGSAACVANVGDSRAYLLRGSDCTQITQDHSLVAEQVRLGILTPAMAAASPLATTITRALGVAPEVEPDLFAAELLPGDRILLATDGLMRHVSDSEIAELVRSAYGLEAACDALVKVTRQRGAADNVTCLLIEVNEA